MSFGDYMTRYVLGFFDPNAKIKWMKDGKLDMPAALQDVLKNIWTGVTYAAGEDMAVAIPYVYGLRLQRHIINKFSPGFKYDSDRSLNGGSVKVAALDAEGKVIGKGHFAQYDPKTNQLISRKAISDIRIVGDYQLEGALDLMGRFSWYNVGTKMFRDTYGHAAIAWNNWWYGDRKIGLPSINPSAFMPEKLINTAKTFVRYVIRTTVKVMMYMLPATFFFYITRTPQSKYLGRAIHPELGPLGFINKGEFKTVLADPKALEAMGDTAPVGDQKEVHFEHDTRNKVVNPYLTVRNGYEHRPDPFSNDIYPDGVGSPWYNKFTNAIGRVCYSAGDIVNEGLMPILHKKLGVSADTVNDFSRKYANAAIAYTPYFMMKTDTGSVAWDTKRTDLGIDRTLSGIAHLKWNDFSGGFGEVYRSMLGQPFAEPARERLAKEAMKRDAEKRSNEGFQLLRGRGGDRNIEDNDDKTRNTRGNGQKIFATDDKKANRPTLTSLRQSTTPKPRETSWATQEAMNKSEAESRNQTIH
jgi:hypothetical protein